MDVECSIGQKLLWIREVKLFCNLFSLLYTNPNEFVKDNYLLIMRKYLYINIWKNRFVKFKNLEENLAGKIISNL